MHRGWQHELGSGSQQDSRQTWRARRTSLSWSPRGRAALTAPGRRCDTSGLQHAGEVPGRLQLPKHALATTTVPPAAQASPLRGVPLRRRTQAGFFLRLAHLCDAVQVEGPHQLAGAGVRRHQVRRHLAKAQHGAAPSVHRLSVDRSTLSGNRINVGRPKHPFSPWRLAPQCDDSSCSLCITTARSERTPGSHDAIGWCASAPALCLHDGRHKAVRATAIHHKLGIPAQGTSVRSTGCQSNAVRCFGALLQAKRIPGAGFQKQLQRWAARGLRTQLAMWRLKPDCSRVPVSWRRGGSGNGSRLRAAMRSAGWSFLPASPARMWPGSVSRTQTWTQTRALFAWKCVVCTRPRLATV